MSHFRNSKFSFQDRPNYGTDFQELKKARKMTDDILFVCNNNEEGISGQISAIINKHQHEIILEKGLLGNQETRNQIRGLGRKLESLNRGMMAISRNGNRRKFNNYQGLNSPNGNQNQLGQGRHILRQRNQNAHERYRLDNNMHGRTHVEENNQENTWTSNLKCGGQAKHSLNLNSES
jgi:hypothetical protein